MTPDLIVEEIRKIREEHAAHYNNDLHAICEAIREEERKSGRTFVRLPIRKIAAASPVPTTGLPDAEPASHR